MDGVIVTPLKQIDHPKGNIMHAMKKSDIGYVDFGEAYFSMVHKGDIKGWKLHTEMTLNLVVISGEIEFVVYSETMSDFFTVKLSANNYQRLTVQPGLWMAFRGLGGNNMLLNLASIEHNPAEAITKDITEIVYDWN